VSRHWFSPRGASLSSPAFAGGGFRRIAVSADVGGEVREAIAVEAPKMIGYVFFGSFGEPGHR
jgi:hypothetical protein